MLIQTFLEMQTFENVILKKKIELQSYKSPT